MLVLPKLWNEGELVMNEKEKYLAFLKQRVDAAVDNIAAAAAQSIVISNKTDITEQESHEILEALSDAAGNLGNIYEYLKLLETG